MLICSRHSGGGDDAKTRGPGAKSRMEEAVHVHCAPLSESLEQAIILSINMAAFVACFKNKNTTLTGVCSCTLLPRKKHKLINCGNEIKRRTYPHCYKRNVIKEIMPEKFLEKIKFGRNTKSDMNICKISLLVIFKMPRSPLTRG